MDLASDLKNYYLVFHMKAQEISYESIRDFILCHMKPYALSEENWEQPYEKNPLVIRNVKSKVYRCTEHPGIESVYPATISNHMRTNKNR